MYTATTPTLTPGITPYTATEVVLEGISCPADVTYVEGSTGTGYEVLVEQAPGLPLGFETFVSVEDACFSDTGLLSVPLPALSKRGPSESRVSLAAPKPLRLETLAVGFDDVPLEKLARS